MLCYVATHLETETHAFLNRLRRTLGIIVETFSDNCLIVIANEGNRRNDQLIGTEAKRNDIIAKDICNLLNNT